MIHSSTILAQRHVVVSHRQNVDAHLRNVVAYRQSVVARRQTKFAGYHVYILQDWNHSNAYKGLWIEYVKSEGNWWLKRKYFNRSKNTVIIARRNGTRRQSPLKPRLFDLKDYPRDNPIMEVEYAMKENN